MSSEKPRSQIWDEWTRLVNIPADDLSDWLGTEESHAVGDTDTGESTGHKSGRRIVDILQTAKADLTDAQWDHMARVVGYIERHTAQGGPEEDVENSAWRYSLMNWGHDPMKSD